MQQLQQQHLPEQYAPLLIGRIGQQQVERKVLGLEADRLGLQVSDDDLRTFLRTGTLSQYLFPGGTFIGQEQYINFVQQYFGISVADFGKEVKSDLELQRHNRWLRAVSLFRTALCVRTICSRVRRSNSITL